MWLWCYVLGCCWMCCFMMRKLMGWYCSGCGCWCWCWLVSGWWWLFGLLGLMMFIWLWLRMCWSCLMFLWDLGGWYWLFGWRWLLCICDWCEDRLLVELLCGVLCIYVWGLCIVIVEFIGCLVLVVYFEVELWFGVYLGDLVWL